MYSPTVLYVDDSPQLLKLRKTALESEGYSVKIAASSFSAMRILHETPIDAVLLEYKLEGLDAEAIARHIKDTFPNLPIILLSAFFEMPERILWLVDEFVLKSELPQGLISTIKRLTHEANTKDASPAPWFLNAA